MLRKTIFWMHLACGVSAGLVVAMMSLTGVLLTYERQIVAWADRAQYADAASAGERRSLDALLEQVRAMNPGFTPSTITLRSDPRAPVAFTAGRDRILLANPYTGAVAEQGGRRLRAFFESVEGWHRWFDVGGASRATARAITGAANFAFLFLVLSGMYLWLPRVWNGVAFRTRLLFKPKATSGKARDFNWHHVFGIWSALPLAVIVASAVVFSYPWANNLVYRSVGEEPPARGPPGGGPGFAPTGSPDASAARERLSYADLFARAAAGVDGWRTLTLTGPLTPGATTARFSIDLGNGGQPQLRHTLALDAATGATQSWQPFSSQSTGQKARVWIRFLHTGEALGVLGQTIAGIVSLTSLVMVWTGLALAYRRLIVPLYSKKRRATA